MRDVVSYYSPGHLWSRTVHRVVADSGHETEEGLEGEPRLEDLGRFMAISQRSKHNYDNPRIGLIAICISMAGEGFERIGLIAICISMAGEGFERIGLIAICISMAGEGFERIGLKAICISMAREGFERIGPLAICISMAGEGFERIGLIAICISMAGEGFQQRMKEAGRALSRH
ncbi:hypothetical protein RRG08_034944 [Elysia crispata]|uniref:Uncharacterized protein n=1 Tax=Elysia crispata TaxID=231223 RepID=A0AAE0Y1Y4_9GAST|nr:hypothetical protein RRG08_034944 [Elysia crispata]